MGLQEHLRPQREAGATEVAVRVATVADVETLFDIRTSVRENFQSRAELAEIGITPDSIAEMLQTTSRAWLAFVAGVPAAFSMADHELGTVFGMFVRPEYEARGLGRRLMQEAEAWLFDSCDDIWLLTGSDPRIRANGFYMHLGWQPLGLQDDGQTKYCKTRPR